MKSDKQIPSFIKFLEDYHPEKGQLSGELKDFLETIIQQRKYRKHHILVHEEQVPHYAWFIVEGAARVYYYNESQSQEETCWFWYPGQMMFSLRSSFRQLLAGEYVELLRDSTLLVISMYDLRILTSRFPEYRLIERAMIEDYQCRINDYNRIVTTNINERFVNILRSNKEIFSLTSLKNIASFMKMHRSTLSYYRALHFNDPE